MHQHDYELLSIDPDAGGAQARKATFRCTVCGEQQSIITAKTDDEIAAALAEAKAGA